MSRTLYACRLNYNSSVFTSEGIETTPQVGDKIVLKKLCDYADVIVETNKKAVFMPFVNGEELLFLPYAGLSMSGNHVYGAIPYKRPATDSWLKLRNAGIQHDLMQFYSWATDGVSLGSTVGSEVKFDILSAEGKESEYDILDFMADMLWRSQSIETRASGGRCGACRRRLDGRFA